MSPNKIFMFIITPPPPPPLAEMLKLPAKHVFECLKKSKREDGKK